MASVVAFGKRSGKRCNSFPLPRVRNIKEITDEVQEHPLAGGRHKAAADLSALIEIADFDSQRSGNAVPLAGGRDRPATLGAGIIPSDRRA